MLAPTADAVPGRCAALTGGWVKSVPRAWGTPGGRQPGDDGATVARPKSFFAAPMNGVVKSCHTVR
jgi:hypothetical protein